MDLFDLALKRMLLYRRRPRRRLSAKVWLPAKVSLRQGMVARKFQRPIVRAPNVLCRRWRCQSNLAGARTLVGTRTQRTPCNSNALSSRMETTFHVSSSKLASDRYLFLCGANTARHGGTSISALPLGCSSPTTSLGSWTWWTQSRTRACGMSRRRLQISSGSNSTQLWLQLA